MSEVSEFYDEFAVRQKASGINNRHLSILYHLQKAGLKSDSIVLEIGCGIGTVSELILRTLSDKGNLHAVDISPESIKMAKIRLRKYGNATLEIRDLTQEVIREQFDIVVMPDVIEHIPFDLHDALFKNVFEMLTENGFVFIHIPHPNHLEWLVKNESKELQIIDQPIHTHQLLSTVYPIGFYLHALKSYSVYIQEEDYQILILKKKEQKRDYTVIREPFRLSFYERVRMKIRYLIRGHK